jgi:CheY-like chemotaxis protein
MDGYAVARALRQRGRPPAYLVAVSGYGRDEDRRSAHEAGFDLHLTKPISYTRLSEALAGLPLAGGAAPGGSHRIRASAARHDGNPDDAVTQAN